MTQAAPFHRIVAFRLSVFDPARLGRFYIEGLGFESLERSSISARETTMLGLRQGGGRWSLGVGDQSLELDRFDQPGRPYPLDSGAADLVFQHCALVVTDAAAAYQRALGHGAIAISIGGPVELPPSAQGVIAVKFRDPEGHPLEFLQFRPGSAGRWAHAKPRDGPLGIDHSAISIADVEVSARFYEARGLRRGAATFNWGRTQADLDGLTEPRVDVVPLLPALGAPHLELLGYQAPRGRPMRGLRTNDIGATRIVWASDQDGVQSDPDGHLHQFERRP